MGAIVQFVATDGALVAKAMKSIPTDDDALGRSTIRADSRQMSMSYRFEMKKPSEGKLPWDCCKLVGTTSGGKAIRDREGKMCAEQT